MIGYHQSLWRTLTVYKGEAINELPHIYALKRGNFELTQFFICFSQSVVAYICMTYFGQEQPGHTEEASAISIHHCGAFVR